MHFFSFQRSPRTCCLDPRKMQMTCFLSMRVHLAQLCSSSSCLAHRNCSDTVRDHVPCDFMSFCLFVTESVFGFAISHLERNLLHELVFCFSFVMHPCALNLGSRWGMTLRPHGVPLLPTSTSRVGCLSLPTVETTVRFGMT